MARRERRWALLVSAVVVIATALPGLRLVASDAAPDGFPLSTYPMFTRDRGRVVELPTVLVESPGGDVERLSPTTIAGTDQVIQAGVTVRQAIRAGRAAALCDEVAARVDAPGTVAVVVERHDVVAWSAGDREPLDRRTLVRCRPGAG
ncbi:MAG TPA: hypothetical protein VFZ77_19685 [Acidimicrobiales bacterium]